MADQAWTPVRLGRGYGGRGLTRIPPRSRVERALDDLYAELPTINCRGACVRSCGPIGVAKAERARIARRTKIGPLGADLTCPLLKNGRCSVHAVRPIICRLWGAVDSMPCLWGCVPSRILTHEEGLEFLRRARELGGGAVPLA